MNDPIRERRHTMTQPPLSQSASKSELCNRLKLSESTHRLLLAEAVAARNALSSNRYNLTEQSRADPSVAEPYRWDELSETSKHLHILMIVRDACAETRPYYDIGRYMLHVNEENWVARWYLWHSFRYRDNRPRERVPNDNGNKPYYDPARDHYNGRQP